MKVISFHGMNLILNRRAGTRQIKLRLNKKGDPVVTFPFLCREATAVSFAEQHVEWIVEQQAKHKKISFSSGMTLNILGQTLTIRHTEQSNGKTYINNNDLMVFGKQNFVHRRVRDFIKQETLSYIRQKATLFSKQIDKKIVSVRLKDTTSRWGSCSGKGNLNFSWRLGLAPLFVLDYIIAHEVAHLAHLNHSDQFWKTVSLFNTDQANAEIWLRKNAYTLHTWHA